MAVLSLRPVSYYIACRPMSALQIQREWYRSPGAGPRTGHDGRPAPGFV